MKSTLQRTLELAGVKPLTESIYSTENSSGHGHEQDLEQEFKNRLTFNVYPVKVDGVEEDEYEGAFHITMSNGDEIHFEYKEHPGTGEMVSGLKVNNEDMTYMHDHESGDSIVDTVVKAYVEYALKHGVHFGKHR